MINILLPLAGRSNFFENERFPKALIEINGTSMIQYAIDYLRSIKRPTRFIFVIRANDSIRFHLDNTLALLAPTNSIIVRQEGDTKGAVCSCLLAIEHINNEDPLIISNADQFINHNIEEVIDEFEKKKTDGGVICFDSVHPQWSYARLDSNSNVLQTAEKNPISRNAIAGFYYFRQGADFVRAAQDSILNRADVNGLYYIAPTYNELILEGKTIAMHIIDKRCYHSFYSLQKIEEFEKATMSNRLGIKV